MAVLSTQRSQALKEHIAQFSTVYAAHRPAVQRTLNIAFVAYVLGSTYLSLSGGSRKSSNESTQRKGKSRAKKGEPGKPAKVAVRIPTTRSLGIVLNDFYRLTLSSTAVWDISYG